MPNLDLVEMKTDADAKFRPCLDEKTDCSAWRYKLGHIKCKLFHIKVLFYFARFTVQVDTDNFDRYFCHFSNGS